MAYTTIDDPSKYFDVTLWTGDGGARTITGLNHKPDLIWTKPRNKTYNHMWSDSSRGFNANSELGSNSTAAEGGLSAETYGYKSGHTSDGWTMVDGTDTSDNQEDGNTNEPNVNYVGWTWAANGGTRTTNTESGNNPAGGYQANTTAGFSVVDYTGTGGAGTMAHGLGAVPDTIWVKNIDQSDNWAIYTSAKGNTHYGIFNTYGNWEDDDTVWNDTSPTSTVFTVGTSHLTNADGEKYLAYCFTNIQGYQKHGKYTGNGNADGPFVYTGFKPAYLWVKYDGNGENWRLYDNKRSTFNEMDDTLVIQDTNAEATNNDLDFLSNGFKLRSTDSNSNGSGATIYYYAVAEHPFVSSKGVPCTAR